MKMKLSTCLGIVVSLLSATIAVSRQQQDVTGSASRSTSFLHASSKVILLHKGSNSRDDDGDDGGDADDGTVEVEDEDVSAAPVAAPVAAAPADGGDEEESVLDVPSAPADDGDENIFDIPAAPVTDAVATAPALENEDGDGEDPDEFTVSTLSQGDEDNDEGDGSDVTQALSSLAPDGGDIFETLRKTHNFLTGQPIAAPRHKAPAPIIPVVTTTAKPVPTAPPPPPVYSTRDCNAGMYSNSGYDDDVVYNTTCRFNNVCYDLSSDKPELLYFTAAGVNDDDDQVLPSIDLRPMSQESNRAVRPDFQFVKGGIPVDTTVWQQGVTVLFQPFGAENFGHEIGDDMYAVFVMQQLMGVASPFDSQLLTLDSCTRKEADGADRSKCVGMMAKLYPALSRHPVLQLKASDLWKVGNASTAVQEKTSLMCFERLIAGAGALSFRSPEIARAGDSYFAYRSFLLRNALQPCANGICGGKPSGKKIVLIMEKNEFAQHGMGEGIADTDQLQFDLAQALPKHDIQLKDLARLSFKDQLALLSQTVAMFSHCGGGSFSGIFLPPGATLAVQTKGIGGPNKYWLTLEMDFWKSLHWITFREVPKTITSDIAETIINESPLAKADADEFPVSSQN